MKCLKIIKFVYNVIPLLFFKKSEKKYHVLAFNVVTIYNILHTKALFEKSNDEDTNNL